MLVDLSEDRWGGLDLGPGRRNGKGETDSRQSSAERRKNAEVWITDCRRKTLGFTGGPPSCAINTGFFACLSPELSHT